MTSSTTHPSLLSRLRDPANNAAWREFDSRYGDLILRYACRRGLQQSDAEDVRQLVMLSLSKALAGFHYDPDKGRFRGYLGQVVRRAIMQFQRAERPKQPAISLNSVGWILEAQSPEQPDPLWDEEWVDHHFRAAMRLVRATFEPRSVTIFEQLLAGKAVHAVAQEFGMSEQAVHKIKQRIRNRLRDIISRRISDETGPHHEHPSQPISNRQRRPH